MKTRRKRNSTGIALAAAVALFIQSLLGSHGLAAGPVQLDIFGNVICVAGSAKTMPGSHGGGHVPDCCMLGCGGTELLANVPGTADGLAAPVFEAETALPVIANYVPRGGERTPANPRAPPPAA